MTQLKTRRGLQKTILALAATFGLALSSQAGTVGWSWGTSPAALDPNIYNLSETYIVLYQGTPSSTAAQIYMPLIQNPYWGDMYAWMTDNLNNGNIIVAISPTEVQKNGYIEPFDGYFYFDEPFIAQCPGVGATEQDLYIFVIAPLTDAGKAIHPGKWGIANIFSLDIMDGPDINGNWDVVDDPFYNFYFAIGASGKAAFFSAFDFKQIPEPATGLLILVGGTLALLRRRR